MIEDKNKFTPYKPKPGDKFLKGPIPLEWITRAALEGSSPAVLGFYLWYRHGLLRKKRFKLNLSRLGDFNLSRYAASRALLKLKNTKLVKVERSPGSSPMVTIIF